MEERIIKDYLINEQIADREVRVIAEDGLQVWLRPLAGDFHAAAIINLSPLRRTFEIRFADLGLPSECQVRDLWWQKCEGGFTGSYTCTVEPHATKMVKIRTACLSCDEKK